MSTLLFDIRDNLLKRNDEILDRFPNRTGAEFTRAMGDIAQGLEFLALQADAAAADPLERCRTWRFVGNAYFDLANAKDPEHLKHSAEAFQKAEALLAGIDNDVERLKLDYGFGHTLFHLSDARDLAMVQEARRRYARALELARVHLPGGVERARTALANADRVIALLTQAEGMSRRIADLQAQLEEPETTASEEPAEPAWQDLFGELKRQFDVEKAKGNMEPARQSGLDDLMATLGGLVSKVGTDRSLEEMNSDRDKLDELMSTMLPRVQSPTYSSPSASGDSRSARVLAKVQELKAFIFAAGMSHQKAQGETDKTIDLGTHLGRLAFRIHEIQGDDSNLVGLETDQARGLARGVRWYARRHYLTLARPVWSHAEVPFDPNLVFFSGPDPVRQCLAPPAQHIGLKIHDPVHAGADFAESRWHDLRAAGLAVFDISTPSPQVFFELGIALTLGAELMLIAQRGTRPPFDIAQNVLYYANVQELESLLPSALDDALYGIQSRGGEGSSLAASVAHAGRLAEAVGNDGLLRVAHDSLRKVALDPVQVPAALKLLSGYLGTHTPVPLYPRWPGVYPDPQHPRCFIVMPFRDKLARIHETIAQAAQQAGIHPIRGDMASGQEIIKSIWEEIGRATHIVVDLTDFNPNVCLELGIAYTLGRRTLLIATEGTEANLETALPSIAKRRCHTYPGDPASKPAFMRALTGFLHERGDVI